MKQMSYLGALKFPAQDYDLTSIPDNERAGSDAAAMMPYVRMSALFLRESDKELEAKVRASADEPDGLDEWLTLLESIGAALDAKRQDAEMLEAGFTRLLVVIERVIGKAEIEAAYRAPTDEADSRKHLAGIRARLHSRKVPFKPRLVTGRPS